jgi:N-acetylmuramoyl-L-alanine amidase-like protein
MPRYYEVVPLSPASMLARVAVQDLGTWCKFVTLHNTSAPSLAQWAHNRLRYSPSELMQNMEGSWRALHWHTGPHYCVVPEADTPIFELSDPSAPGVHASCFNSVSIGIEMVGEYNVEDFNGGPGQVVRDNAVLLLAALHNKLGLAPVPFAYDVRGLHFHRDCVRDHHDCPGTNVVRADVVARVQAKMAELRQQAPVAGAPSAPVPTVSVTGTMSTFGGPDDVGVAPDEGLALIELSEAADFAGLFLPAQPPGTTGLARRLDPEAPYVACRWNYAVTPKEWLRAHKVSVANPKTGKSALAQPVDWGPDPETGRAADLSPGLAESLSLATGDVCLVSVPPPTV